MTLSRRKFLLSSTALVTLAACTQAQVAAAIASGVLSWAQANIAELQPVLNAQGVSIPSAVTLTLSGIVSTLQTLNTTSTEVQGESVFNKVIGYINALTPVVVPIISTLYPPAGAALGLLVGSLPYAEGLFSAGVAAFNALSPQAGNLVAAAPPPAASLRLGGPAAAPSSKDYYDELMRRHGIVELPLGLTR